VIDPVRQLAGSFRLEGSAAELRVAVVNGLGLVHREIEVQVVLLAQPDPAAPVAE
jgi:hypothetical protein